MTQEKSGIINTLKQLKPELQERFGVTKLALFGSYARDEATEDSDIDIVIIKMTRKNGFLIAKAKRFISDKLQKKVDIGLYSAINPYVKKCIEKDMIYV